MAARKTSTLPTRVWSFSCRVDDEQTIDRIGRTARRYYNELVEIERARHARFVEIRRRYAPDLAVAEDRLIEIEDEIAMLIRDAKKERQTYWRESGARIRSVPEGHTNRVEALRAERRDISASAKTLRAAFDAIVKPATAERKRRSIELANGGGPSVKSTANAAALEQMLEEPEWSDAWKDIARSDDAAHKARLAARASCGLATGTYLAVEEAATRAIADSFPRPPRFRRYDGNAKISVQPRDVTMSDVMAGTRALTIRQAPHIEGKRGDQSRMHIVEIDQSVPRGERMTLRAVAKMHRMPPQDAAIKWASIVVRYVGGVASYRLQLTMEHASFADAKRAPGIRETEHVQIGWASVDRGVRVAHWPSGDVVVPDSILAQHSHAASLESVSDARFERAKRLLRLITRRSGNDLTAWHRMRSDRARAQLRAWCIEYAQFVFGAELASMWRRWKSDRKTRGVDLYADAWELRRMAPHESSTRTLAWWAYIWARKDEHLRQVAVDSRRRFVDRRDYFFRREAIRIATEFSSVTVDSYKISPLRELPSLTMPGDAPRDRAQHNATAAAPGRFREILLEVMGPRCTPCERRGDAKTAGGARASKPKKKSLAA